jgi:subtilisin family serine protease
MRRRTAGPAAAAVLVAAVAATSLAVHPPQAAGSPANPAGRPGSAASLTWQTVTLLTGDHVRVGTGADGQQVAQVQPAPGRERMVFFRRSHGRQLLVLPADAAPMVARGQLDQGLFDVTGLVREGFADSARPDLPLIVSNRPGRRPQPLGGTRTSRALPALNGLAVTERKADAGAFWTALTGGAAADVGHVWLDGRVHARLDHSVPQIGAPAAWQAGYTGRGVTVAVLDSGIDATHPDLADAVAAARDFTGGSTGTTDGAGHGTHVASIITGSGAASGGRYVGVAPDARLAIGKVLDDTGSGAFSQVIAGMEWAATEQHARVVNMSLGLDAGSDGTDPISATLNSLTASTGTLFVVAAGNAGQDEFGEHDESVGIPGVADAALTVGAVDGADALAPFSSRGPRRGDAGVKPDLTAPGVGIVAARAAGTELGEVVGDAYVRLDGTSMATPHVAGAAAILAQQHPDWTAGRLKAALMNTAAVHPGTGVYGQGAGRVDVARAVSTRAWASPASVAVDLTPAGPATVTRQVALHNDADTPVTLTLSAATTGPDGQPAPAVLAVAPSQVTIPPGGSAPVTVTAHRPATGRYSGRLTATSAGSQLTVPVGVVAEPQLYTVHVAGIDRAGHPAGGSLETLPWLDLLDLTTGQYAPVFVSGNGIAARVPAGRYDLAGYVDTPGPDGQIASSALVSIPTLTIDKDVTVTADARRAHLVSATVDSRTAVHSGVDVAGVAQTVAGQFTASGTGSVDPAVGLYVTATPKVTSRPYAFYYKTIRAEPLGGAAPKAYNLALMVNGQVPSRPTFRVADRDLAQLDSRFHADGTPLAGTRTTIQVLPGEDFPFGGGDYPVQLPGRRIELYSASPGLRWFRVLGADSTGPDGGFLSEAANDPAMRPGDRLRFDWNSAALGTVVAPGPRAKCGPGQVLMVAYPFVSPGDAYGFTPGTQQVSVSRNGVPLGSVDDIGGCFATPPGAASYSLHLTADRSLAFSALGTHADTTWTSAFTPNLDDRLDSPPMINVRVTGGFDMANRAPAGQPFRLDVSAQLDRFDGATTPRTPIRLTRLELSTDDGASWHPAPATATGTNRWAALARTPRGAHYVSLRIRAADGSGDAVTQTIIRAYGLR